MPNQDWWLVFKTKKEGNAPKELSKDLKELKSGLSGAVQELTGFSLSSIGVAAAITGVAVQMKAAVTETVSYAAQVRDLGRISGATAEDTSRLIQTADDLTVEYSTLEQAAKALAKNGIALTTEELAKSADEYLAINDAGGRSEYAVKKFGKAGLELTKVLEQGGAAIREMAASQSDALILTEDQVKKARDFEIAQDAVNDTLQGFKYTVGNAVLPAITSFIKGIDDLLNSEALLTKKHQDEEKQVFDTTTEYKEYAKSIDALNGPMVTQQNALAAQYGAQTKANEAVKKASEEDWKMRDALRQTRAAAEVTAAGFDEFASSVGEATQNVDWNQAALKALGDEAKILSSTLQTNLSGAMAIFAEDKSFAEGMAENDKKAQVFEATISRLGALKYHTPEQQTELDAAKKGLEEVGQAEIALAKKHEEATKSMIFNMLLQKAASDGLTQTEFDNLMKVGVAWGLVSADAATTASNLNAINLDEANTELSGLNSLLSSIMGQPNSKDITVTTNYYEIHHTGHEGGGFGGNGGGGYASGGAYAFRVPSGFPNDSFPLPGGRRAQSGERVDVQVTPANQVTNNYGHTFQLTAQYAYQNERSLRNDIRMMQMLRVG